ncbi:hypothetical protein HXX76_015703 [Chlamydomonas incerta]|uniref:RING-type domain-containing protein n=1 Tax=Chlamydomonas incerta TaxID=51695 RepID=A0A835S8T4_CHLIN|nr:hypothetical protein HXX76_015703 [Chlamydomonas incerta]|eukprot:KAG2422872.1 hypothetical protein HXX76_015703 [Chlamydomonas incerta]
MWLGLQPELLKYQNMSDGDTVWHVAAVTGNAEVLEALAAHAPALEELEAQRRELQRNKSSRRRRDATSTGRVTPRAEQVDTAAGGGGRGSGSGSSSAGGALSETERTSPSQPSQPASPSEGALSESDVRQTQSDGQLQQLDTPEPAQAARLQSLRAVINLRSDKKQTPLMHAANAGRLDVLKWLLQQGADPWAQDRCGLRSALHYAAMRGHVDCVLALLDHMPSTAELRRYLEYRSISGLTPLHYAVATGQVEVARLLLQRGADMMAVNLIGDAYDLVHVPKRSTPLHVAAAFAGPGGLQCALALLQHYHHNLAGPAYPDPRRRVDFTGRTPYQVANFYRTQSALMSELLHPASDLPALFEREGGGVATGAGGGTAHAEGGSVAMPVLRLKQIAAAAVRQQLLGDIEHAERVIQHFRRRHRAAGGLDRLSPFASISSPAVGHPDQRVPLPGGVDDSGGLEQLEHEPPSSRSGSRRGVDKAAAATCCPAPMQQRVGGCLAAAAPVANDSGNRSGPACEERSCCEGAKGCGSVKASAGCCPAGSAMAAAVVVPGGAEGVAKTCCDGGECASSVSVQGAAAGAAAGSAVEVVPCCTPEDRQRGACCSAPCVCSSNCRPGPAPQPLAGGGGAAAAVAAALSRASSKAGPSLQPSTSTVGSSSAGTLGPVAAAAALLQGPLPDCCTVRQPLRPFASRSVGYAEEGIRGAGARRPGAAAGRGGAFASAPLVPVAQCAVCLEDAFCLVSEPCHHRLCATCSRDVTQRATALPLACVVCREPVFQFTSPVC